MVYLEFQGYDLCRTMKTNNPNIKEMWVDTNGHLSILVKGYACPLTFVPKKLHLAGLKTDFRFKPIVLYRDDKLPEKDIQSTCVKLEFYESGRVEFIMYCLPHKIISFCGLRIKIV